MNTLIKKTSLLAAAAAYLGFGLFSSIVKADDTEVYFYKGSLLTPGKPQIVMTLDVTSSMNGKGGGSTTRLNMVRQALLDIPDAKIYNEDGTFDGYVKDKANLALLAFHSGVDVPVLFHMNNIAVGGSTAAYDPTKNDKSWDKAVDYIPTGKAFTGSTPLDDAAEESARYILGTKINHINASTDAFSFSPFTKQYNGFLGGNSCGSTTLIMMASGQANGPKTYSNEIKADVITDAGDQATYCSGGICGRNSVVEFMKEEHNIKTYAITPKQNTSKNLYKNLLAMSQKGGTGVPIMFDSANELTTQITNIIQKVVRQGSSFVQAGVTVSQQNRLQHDNQLYYAQFQPDAVERWPGNLKKYKFLTDAVRGQDTTTTAVDLSTGLFKKTAQSYWTDAIVTDGNNVNKGGSASVLEDLFSFSAAAYSTRRNVYIDNGTKQIKLSAIDPTSLADVGVLAPLLDVTDGTDIGFPAGSFNQLEATEILHDWMTGVSYDPINLVYSANNEIGDPLHSEPKLLRYKVAGGTDADPMLKTLSIFGTNEGYIHAVEVDQGQTKAGGNTSTGREVWSYIPGQLLKNMKQYYINASKPNPEDRHYGVDGEITIAHADTNFNLYVDNNEKVMMYVGFRRGTDTAGVSSYYALDISSGQPQLAFAIHSDDPTYSTMGQTWGEPTISNMMVGGKRTAVMLFSGGYDEATQDVAGGARVNSTKGNDIFIVNALTGKFLWKASTDHTLKYSMVGKLNTFQFNNRGLAEYFYAADLGGQIFRFDINNSGSDFTIKGHLIAELQTGASAAENRRFFYPPSVGYFSVPGGDDFISIAIGSGYRAHPLDATVADHFYVIRDTKIFDKSFRKTTLSNLVNVTSNLDSENIKSQIAGGKARLVFRTRSW